MQVAPNGGKLRGGLHVACIMAKVARGSIVYNSESTVSILPGSMQKLPLEQERQVKTRKEAFAVCWQAVEKEINAVMVSQYDQVLEELLRFILLAQSKLQTLFTASQARHQPYPPIPEVQTAVLVVGVNVSDHAALFERLRGKVHSDASPYTVTLKAKDCNSGMKTIMQRILLQLMQMNIDQDSSSDEEEALRPLPAKRRVPRCSMWTLCNWYQDTVQSASPGTRPPVVIIIEDLEASQPNTIQDLIMCLSERQLEFPCVLVLGVATSISVIPQLLAQRAVSLLTIEQFHTQQSSLTVASVVKKVLMTHRFPFKLGPKALNFLLHQFFFWNLSLTDFTQGLKFAMMEHFDWQPLSPLCGTPAANVWTQGFLEAARATASMQRFIESQTPQRRLDLLESDSKMKGQVRSLVGNLEQYHQIFYPFLCCLHHLTHSLPGAPLGKKLHELYLLSLERNIVQDDSFKKAWELVGMLSKENIAEPVSLCVQELTQATFEISGPALKVIKDTLAVFERFRQESTKSNEATVSETPSPSSSSPTVTVTTAQRKKKLQEKQQSQVESCGTHTLFESARKKLTDALLEIFTSHLQAPRSLPLHEIFYFDRVSFMQSHLSPAPRSVIQRGLTQPLYYLSEEAGDSVEDTVSPDQPDVCILYQLHLECGKLINLYDLLQSFVAVVSPDDATTDEEDLNSKKVVDPVVHARFIQAVNVLQLLGFVKPTQRKADHVQRLTWGPL